MNKAKEFLLIFGLFMTLSCAYAQDKSSNQIDINEKVTFEVVVVTLNEGVTMDQLLAADKKMEDNFVSTQKGYINREVAVSKNGKDLFVIVRWDTLENAEKAAEAFMKDPYAQKRMSLAKITLYNHYTK